MLTKEQLWKLRLEVPIGSLFVNDYENSFEIPAKQVCDFFDGYLDVLWDIAADDIPDMEGVDFEEAIDRYDCPENLYNWYIDCQDNGLDPLASLWILTMSKDAIDVDQDVIIQCVGEPGYWDCQELADKYGCDYWTVEPMEYDTSVKPDVFID